MEGLIDYAGLFPPARLPLDQSLMRYSLHAESDERFMLGRFITPVFEVNDLAEMRAEQSIEALPLSVIARAADHIDALTQTITEDLASLRSAEEASGGAVRSEVVEIKLPGDAAEPGAMDHLINAIAPTGSNLRFFFEVPLLNGGLDAAYTVISAVKSSGSKLDTPGIKLRTGGLVPEAFPSTAEVAHVIAACAEAQVPFKATAGLHHPIRHHNPTIPIWEHGFLNVFGAAALAYTHRLAPAQIEAVIRETRLDRFTASDEHFGWADILISNDELLAARRFATSYGSCSFDEPVADLRAAGWLQVQSSMT